jgi:hypothetical protein
VVVEVAVGAFEGEVVGVEGGERDDDVEGQVGGGPGVGGGELS